MITSHPPHPALRIPSSASRLSHPIIHIASSTSHPPPDLYLNPNSSTGVCHPPDQSLDRDDGIHFRVDYGVLDVEVALRLCAHAAAARVAIVSILAHAAPARAASLSPNPSEARFRSPPSEPSFLPSCQISHPAPQIPPLLPTCRIP